MPIFAKHAGAAYLLAVLIGLFAPWISVLIQFWLLEQPREQPNGGSLLMQGGVCILINAAFAMAAIAKRMTKPSTAVMIGFAAVAAWALAAFALNDGQSPWRGPLLALLISVAFYLLVFAMYASRHSEYTEGNNDS